MDIVQNAIAERLGGVNFGKDTTVYKFAKIKMAKDAAIAANPNIKLIDMGVGEPDIPADPRVVERLSKEAGLPENRSYADNGIPEFQEAAAKYMDEVYGVKDIDPSTQIIHGIGSKPILAMLPTCFINPGDVILMTTPGYPVSATHTEYLGGEVYDLSLTAENNFLPDLDAIPDDICSKAKMLYINYPNNPTGQVATEDFFKKVVAFAKKNNVIVLNDAAYGALVFDGTKPLSFLSTEGAMDIGIEIHSLSKAFNMTGWRLAFVVGNEKIIKAYATVKDNTDSGQFRASQKAGITAMQNLDITQNNCDRYSRRHDLLIEVLKSIGCPIKKPKATFYAYIPCPKGTKSGIKFESGEDFSQHLIKKALISTVPWDNAGNFVRFGMTFAADGIEDEKLIMKEVQTRLQKLELEW